MVFNWGTGLLGDFVMYSTSQEKKDVFRRVLNDVNQEQRDIVQKYSGQKR